MINSNSTDLAAVKEMGQMVKKVRLQCPYSPLSTLY